MLKDQEINLRVEMDKKLHEKDMYTIYKAAYERT